MAQPALLKVMDCPAHMVFKGLFENKGTLGMLKTVNWMEAETWQPFNAPTTTTLCPFARFEVLNKLEGLAGPWDIPFT